MVRWQMIKLAQLDTKAREEMVAALEAALA